MDIETLFPEEVYRVETNNRKIHEFVTEEIEESIGSLLYGESMDISVNVYDAINYTNPLIELKVDRPFDKDDTEQITRAMEDLGYYPSETENEGKYAIFKFTPQED